MENDYKKLNRDLKGREVMGTDVKYELQRDQVPRVPCNGKHGR
jgi:hypothetical protein